MHQKKRILFSFGSSSVTFYIYRWMSPICHKISSKHSLSNKFHRNEIESHCHFAKIECIRGWYWEKIKNFLLFGAFWALPSKTGASYKQKIAVRNTCFFAFFTFFQHVTSMSKNICPVGVWTNTKQTTRNLSFKIFLHPWRQYQYSSTTPNAGMASPSQTCTSRRTKIGTRLPHAPRQWSFNWHSFPPNGLD